MKNSGFTLTERKVQLIVWTLLFCNPLIGMAVDLVAPSLPAIALDLHVSPGVAKGVISIYLLGYALGNFFTGFITDALGRQKLLRLGFCGFVLVSLAPVIFPSIQVLLFARFFQGITIGSAAVIIRAVLSDILPTEKLIRLGALLSAMWGIGPIIGPMIGGYLQFYFGWQAGFCFFAVISFILLIVIFFVVPETHFNRHPLHFKIMQKNLLEIFHHRIFLALISIMGLVYSLIVVFNTAGPFLIQNEFKQTPIFFGRLALGLGVVFLISTIFCRFLLKKFKTEELFLIVFNVLLAISCTLLVVSYLFPQNIILVAIGTACMFFGSGFIFPMAMGKGMSLFRHIAGTANAVMYLVNVLLTSLASFLMSFVTMNTAIPLMWVYFILVFICIVIYWRLIRNPGKNTLKTARL